MDGQHQQKKTSGSTPFIQEDEFDATKGRWISHLICVCIKQMGKYDVLSYYKLQKHQHPIPICKYGTIHIVIDSGFLDEGKSIGASFILSNEIFM